MSTRHCEELTILCIIETSHRLKSLQIRSDRWCARSIQQTSAKRPSLIVDLSRRAKSSNAAALATAIILIYESAEGIFQGKIQALESLMQGDVLEKLYD